MWLHLFLDLIKIKPAVEQSSLSFPLFCSHKQVASCTSVGTGNEAGAQTPTCSEFDS